ncbi:Probable poly(glycerol-phosphate) alpha-glucosyltransferase [Sphingobacterium mizutaii]|nr:Glycosyltransferase involved in cell wall bisynthesis [Sphingobacterium mizutaii]SNV51325.1 Probable poly(glycerol-phosphate) alpha-glucosyltransferase [Sphingobacterium mizutaii]
MKIAYCILGTFNSGGMERVLANKTNYLAKLGHDISIITTDQKNRKPYFDLNASIKQIDLGINYTENNSSGLLKKIFDYPRKQALHKKLLAEKLSEIQPDICVSLFDHEVGLLPDINDGSKKIVEIHFSRFKRLQYGRKGLWKLIDKYRSNKDLRTVQKFDKFVVLTQEDKSYWGDLPNIVVIPNANSFPVAQRSQLDSKNVIAVGRYDYQKRFEDLVDVWKLVHQEEPDWKLNIFGKGPERENLQNQINKLGLEDTLILKEPVRDIDKQYLSSSMIAMTSRYEGLPMALLEGQASGLPLISYTCKCGPKDIIQEGKNGYLLEEGDKVGMANKILTLIRDPELRDSMGQQAFEMSNNFSEAMVMEKWIQLFNDSLNNR